MTRVPNRLRLRTVMPETNAISPIEEVNYPTVSSVASVKRQAPTPRSTIEEQVADLWRQMLGVEDLPWTQTSLSWAETR